MDLENGSALRSDVCANRIAKMGWCKKLVKNLVGRSLMGERGGLSQLFAKINNAQ